MVPPREQLDVLFEDNHLLVVNKPAGLATMGVAGDRPSVLSVAKAYIGQKYRKQGNVYLGVVSRLDAPVTGVLLMARTTKAAGRLNQQFRDHRVEKVYWAVVEGEVEADEQKLTHYLRKDERHRKMHTTSANTPGAVEAVLSFRSLNRRDGQTWLEVFPHTGRKHQIRVQLAKIGHPIFGDRKYGGRVTWTNSVALHAHRLVIEHPVKKTMVEFKAEPPRSWNRLKVVARAK